MKTKLSCSAIAFTIVLGATVCRASDITYYIDLTNIGFDHGSVIGTLETNGTIGTLTDMDFVTGNLEVTEPGTTSFDLTPSDAILSLTGDALTATTTELLYNFAVIGNLGINDGSDGFGLDSTSNPNNNFLFVSPASSASPEFTNTLVVGVATPEPSTLGIMLAVLVALILISRRLRVSSAQ
jgi:hypothetical protein